MEKMFGKMTEGCVKGMSDEDKKKMMACCGEMVAAMSSCTGTKNMTEDKRREMMEKMMACCGSKMEMTSCCFKKTDATPDQGCCTEKA